MLQKVLGNNGAVIADLNTAITNLSIQYAIADWSDEFKLRLF